MQPPRRRRRRRRWPGQLGKVGSPPRRAAPRPPQPRSLSSPSRELGEPREPPGSGLATPRPRPARAGLGTPPAPRVRAAPAPRGAPRTFPAADPPRPVAVPARAGAAAAGRDALCSRRCGRRSRRARRGRSRAGGGGRRRPRAAAAQPPRARAPIAHSHWSCSPTFPPSFFFRMEPATRARRRREETRSRSPARRHAPSCPPSPPPRPAAQQKAIYMRGSDPRPDRAPPPPPAPRTQAKVGAPGGARGAGSGPAAAELRSCARPRPPPALAPRPAHAQLLAPNSSRGPGPRPERFPAAAAPPGGAQRTLALTGAGGRAPPPPGAEGGTKRRAGSGVGSAAAARGLDPRARSWPGANGALASFRVSGSPGRLLRGAPLCNFTRFKFNPIVPEHERVRTTAAQPPRRRRRHRCRRRRRRRGPSTPAPARARHAARARGRGAARARRRLPPRRAGAARRHLTSGAPGIIYARIRPGWRRPRERPRERGRRGAAGPRAAGREGGPGATSRPRAGAGAAGGFPRGPVRGRRSALPARLLERSLRAARQRPGRGLETVPRFPARHLPGVRVRRPRQEGRPGGGGAAGKPCNAARTDRSNSEGWDVSPGDWSIHSGLWRSRDLQLPGVELQVLEVGNCWEHAPESQAREKQDKAKPARETQGPDETC
ncbi:hypothetical protein R6Z07F_009565 [Ovis aries]